MDNSWPSGLNTCDFVKAAVDVFHHSFSQGWLLCATFFLAGSGVTKFKIAEKTVSSFFDRDLL